MDELVAAVDHRSQRRSGWSRRVPAPTG